MFRVSPSQAAVLLAFDVEADAQAGLLGLGLPSSGGTPAGTDLLASAPENEWGTFDAVVVLR